MWLSAFRKNYFRALETYNQLAGFETLVWVALWSLIIALPTNLVVSRSYLLNLCLLNVKEDPIGWEDHRLQGRYETAGKGGQSTQQHRQCADESIHLLGASAISAPRPRLPAISRRRQHNQGQSLPSSFFNSLESSLNLNIYCCIFKIHLDSSPESNTYYCK